MKTSTKGNVVGALACLLITSAAYAAEEQGDLAQKLQNPVADLISVPIQNNWDFGIGPADAMKYTANIFSSLADHW